MKREWKILLIVLLVLLVFLGFIIFYFYKFHTFYTVRFCIKEESRDLKVPCSSDERCKSLIKNSEEFNKEDFPEGFEDEIGEVIEKIIYCENTCKIKEIYGEGINNVGHVEECKMGEEAFEYEINGEKGLKLWKSMKEKI